MHSRLRILSEWRPNSARSKVLLATDRQVFLQLWRSPLSDTFVEVHECLCHDCQRRQFRDV